MHIQSVVIPVLVAVIAFGVGYWVGYRQATRGLPFISKHPKL